MADRRHPEPVELQLVPAAAGHREGTGNLRDRTRLNPLARFLDGMAVAIERGTPWPTAARAGRRRPGPVQTPTTRIRYAQEIAMMVPDKTYS